MLKATLLLLKREWFNLSHDHYLLLIVFIVPLICMALFTAIYGNGTLFSIPAAIVDMDNSESSRMVIEQFEAAENLKIKAYYHSFDELEEAIKKGDIIAGVVIPKNFGENIILRRATRILMVIDGTNMIYATNSGTTLMEIAETLRATVGVKTLLAYRPTEDDDLYSSVSSLTDGLDVTLSDVTKDNSSISSTGNLELDMNLYNAGYTMADALKVYMPVNFKDEAWFNPTQNYSYFLLLGLFMNVWQQCMTLFCCVNVIGSTGSSSWLHFKTGVISMPRIFITKSLLQIIILIVTSALILKISFSFLKLPSTVSFSTWMIFMSCFSIALHGFCTMVSSLMNDSVDATRLTMIVALPSFVLSGFSWPLEEMLENLHKIVLLLPQTWFFQGLNYLSFKSPKPEFITHYCTIFLIMAAICYLISIIGITIKERL